MESKSPLPASAPGAPDRLGVYRTLHLPHTKEELVRFVPHLLHDRIITHAVLRQHRYLDLAVIGVGTHMQFAPSAALGISMLANLPFPFPVDFQARAIQHQVQTLGGFLGQSYSKLLAAFGQG